MIGFKPVLAVIVLAAAVHLTAFVKAQVPPKEGTATVAGVVTLKGEPARNVSVALQPTGQYNQKEAQRAKTDDAGRFRFERVKAGRYMLGALAPGFVAPSENQSGIQGKTINVADGENAEAEIALRPGGVITGRVTDSRGNPVVGEAIELARLNEQGKPESLWLGPNGMFYGTDDRGIYRIYGLPAGRYLVSIGFEQRPNSITMTTKRVLYPKTYYPNTATTADAKIVKVGEGQEVTGIDISAGTVRKNYDVAGRLTYAENGQPAANVEIGYGVIASSGNSIGPSARNDFRTNAAGEFRLQNILPGKYVAFAQPEKGENTYSDTARFEIADADVEGLELKLHRGGTISGTALITGTNDPAVLGKLAAIQFLTTVKSQNLAVPNFNNRISISANGSFVVKGLAPGRVVLFLAYNPALPTFTILQIERDGVPQPDGIELGADEQISGVRVVIAYGKGVIRGQVQIVGGTIPSSILLRAYVRQPGSGLTAGSPSTIDVRGQFRIENLPLSEYELVLGASSRTEEAPPGFEELRRFLETFKQRVTVGEGETPVTVTLDLSRKGGN
ncbi:MAG: carboxypeptidase-like regulatory domain-containing protein [Acidobacteriota bacterium]